MVTGNFTQSGFMDEERLQAYVNLINEILNCPDGEEVERLKAQPELLDAGLLDVMGQYAEYLRQQGDENRANFLSDFARQLAEALGISSPAASSEEEREARFNFLIEALSATEESNGNPEVVYPLLQAKQEQLDDTFAEMLRRWAEATFAEVETEQAQSIAVVIGNFSNLIKNFPLGNRAVNLEIAITGYQIVGTVFTRETSPETWATTQNNLGNAYRNRIRGEKADNIEGAITAYQAALSVYTREAFPQDWAMTQNNLGNAYSDRIRGEKADNIEGAIAAYQAALEVCTPLALPDDCLQTARNLGNLYFDAGNWSASIPAYDQGIQAVEVSRSWGLTEASRQEISERGIGVYDRVIQACLNDQQLTLALEYTERSKARNLVELVARRDLEPQGNFTAELRETLSNLRQGIRRQQRQLIQEREKQGIAIATQERLQQLTQELEQFITQEITPIDPSFSLTQKVEKMQWSEIQGLLTAGTAIVEWYITAKEIITFVISKEAKLAVWRSTKEDVETLYNWRNKYLEAYNTNKIEWQESLTSRLEQLAAILHLEEVLKLIPQTCSRLMLIPHWFLHLFPLHSLRSKRQGKKGTLMELFPQGISYAPSCQLLQLLQTRQRHHCQSLFAIQNPTEDLFYTDLEVEKILPRFDSQVLARKQATKTALIAAKQELETANYLHFSCHGHFNSTLPQNSHLLLAGAKVSPVPADGNPQRYLKISEDEAIDLSKCLTLDDLFEREFNFTNCRLVVLSACETGLIDFKNISDEYIGLPSGFLYAGSASVVSSLWTVSDLSSAFLILKFIENLQNNDNLALPLALNQAQLWLRDVTKEELQDWTSQLDLDSTWRGEIRYLLKDMSAKTQPFQSPLHWAAFTAVGL